MDKSLIGFLGLFGFLHLFLVAIPIRTTLRAAISARSKMLWCAFLLFLPIIGVLLFHYKYRSSLFIGKPYEPSPHDLGVRMDNPPNDDRE